MGGFFSRPSPPPPPPPPPKPKPAPKPAPQAQANAADQSRVADTRARMGARTRRTKLTGALGLRDEDVRTGRKTLLGA